MSKKKSFPNSWMLELSGLAKKAKTKEGNSSSSHLIDLIRLGSAISWKPFSFSIEKKVNFEEHVAFICEVDSKTHNTKGSKNLPVKLGTQPESLIRSLDPAGKTFFCSDYSITKFEGKRQLLIWKIIKVL